MDTQGQHCTCCYACLFTSHSYSAPARWVLLQPADRLTETVELLAACRSAEVELLEGLSGYRKLMMCWR